MSIMSEEGFTEAEIATAMDEYPEYWREWLEHGRWIQQQTTREFTLEEVAAMKARYRRSGCDLSVAWLKYEREEIIRTAQREFVRKYGHSQSWLRHLEYLRELEEEEPPTYMRGTT